MGPVGTVLVIGPEGMLDGLATVPVDNALKTFGLIVLKLRFVGSCLRRRMKKPSPDPPPTPSVRIMKGEIGPSVLLT